MAYAVQSFSDYPGNSTDRAVFAVIAEYANSQGIAYPTMRAIANKIGKTAIEVCRSVHRLIEKGFMTVSKALKRNDKHPRNVYRIARRYLRKEADTASSHYIAEKWAKLKASAKDVAAAVQKHVTNAAGALSARAAEIAAKWDKWDTEKTGGDMPAPVFAAPAAPAFQLTDSRLNEDLQDMTPGAIWMCRRAILKAPHSTEADYVQALQQARDAYKDYQWD